MNRSDPAKRMLRFASSHQASSVLLMLVSWLVCRETLHFPDVKEFVAHQGLLESGASLAGTLSHRRDFLSDNFALFSRRLEELPAGLSLRVRDDRVRALFFVYAFRGDAFRFVRFRPEGAAYVVDGHFRFSGDRLRAVPLETRAPAAPSGEGEIRILAGRDELTIQNGEKEVVIRAEGGAGACGLAAYPPSLGLGKVFVRSPGDQGHLVSFLHEALAWVYEHPAVLILPCCFLAAVIRLYGRKRILPRVRAVASGKVGLVVWPGLFTLVLMTPVLQGIEKGTQPYLVFALQCLALGWFLLCAAAVARAGSSARLRGKRAVIGFLVLLSVSVPLVALLLIISQSSRIASRADGMVRELRFRQDPAPPPSRGEEVILCLGGSSTEGSPFDLDWPYDYPSQLESMLKRRGREVRVYNAGISAASTWTARELAPPLIRALKPRVVFFSYFENDLNVEAMQKLKERIVPGFLLRRVPHVCRDELVRALAAECRRNGATPVFLVEPLFEWVQGVNADAPPADRGIYDPATFPSELLWDPLPFFREHRDELLFMDGDMHLNRWGNRLLARYLADRIESEIPSPPPDR